MLSIERIRREGEQYMHDMMSEGYLALAAFKSAPDYDAIVRRHADILGPEAVALVHRSFIGASEGSEERNRLRALLHWLVSSVGIAASAPAYQRQMRWESAAVVAGGKDGRPIPYRRIQVEIANELSADRRRALDAARAALVERELLPLRCDFLLAEQRAIEGLSLARDYTTTLELSRTTSFAALRSQCDALLAETQSLWDRARVDAFETRLGIDPDTATTADLAALLRSPAFDAAFPADELVSRALRSIERLGIDPLAGGRIHLDTAVRPGKETRSYCGGVRVPEDIRVITCPVAASPRDWAEFLHEMGHALHFAHTSATLPFEYRRFGDMAVAESYAALFELLLDEPAFLRDNTDLGPRAAEYARVHAFDTLYHLRRRCGRLCFEMELRAGSPARAEMPSRYAAIMLQATGVRHQPADAYGAVDPIFYLVDYLRAHQLRGVITQVLTANFGREWWTNPGSGPWMIDHLFSRGGSDTAAQLAHRLGGAELSFAPVIAAVTRALGE